MKNILMLIVNIYDCIIYEFFCICIILGKKRVIIIDNFGVKQSDISICIEINLNVIKNNEVLIIEMINKENYLGYYC